MAFVLKSQQKARIKETQRSVHWTLGILRHLGVFSWLRVFSAPKQSLRPPQQRPEESVTFVISKSTKNVFFAKILILLGLSLLGGYWFARNGASEYERGRELTQEKYLERFDEYKGALLDAKRYDNPLPATFIMLIVLSFFISSYELTALIIGFMIGKVIRR